MRCLVTEGVKVESIPTIQRLIVARMSEPLSRDATRNERFFVDLRDGRNPVRPQRRSAENGALEAFRVDHYSVTNISFFNLNLDAVREEPIVLRSHMVEDAAVPALQYARNEALRPPLEIQSKVVVAPLSDRGNMSHCGGLRPVKVRA